MQIKTIRFLRSGNVMAPCSGALIALEEIQPQDQLDGARLERWLADLPTTLRLAPQALQGALWQVLPRLLHALSEHTRLNEAPTQVMQQNGTSLTLWLPVDHREAAEASVKLVIHILEAVRQGREPDGSTRPLWAALRSTHWNQSHAHLARAAQQLGIPFQRLDREGQQWLQFGQGRRLRLCQETITDRTPVLARIAMDKHRLHLLLQHRGVPLPAQALVRSLPEALEAAERIGWPVVLKPAIGGKGRGVWVGLPDAETLRRAWSHREHGQGEVPQLLQSSLPGHDHRLLVIDGQLQATARRQPAALRCDGVRSLRDQIHALNADPERGIDYERLRNRIPLDARLESLLAAQGLSLESVPAAGQLVPLSRTANLSQGGSAIDCSDRVHPDNRELAEDIAQLISADAVGLDLISQDISVSWRQGGTWLLEANLAPGLRPHLVANPNSDLCQRIVRSWVGSGARAGRIPTALITGSIGKTTTSRLLAHVLSSIGLQVGLTSSTGIELKGRILQTGDMAGGGLALQLLQDRRVEAMVAEIARGSLLRYGLGIDRVDVAAVLNVLDNHVGMEGIRHREDLASIKALITTPVEGLLVLNAKDPLVLAMAQGRDPAQLALVSEEPVSEAWQQHRRRGQVVVAYRQGPDGGLTLHDREQILLELPLAEIPAAEQGAVVAIAPAAAFTAAMAHGLGLSPEQIRVGLRGFGGSEGHRRGRFELLMTEPYRLMLGAADGPEAMASMSHYAREGPGRSARRRVLLCSAPDTRPDAVIRAVGQQTWGFDWVLCAAWFKRRGREVHEGPALLAEGVRSLGPEGPQALEVGAEQEAVAVLAQQLQPGDFCMVCSFDTAGMRQRLLETLARHDMTGGSHQRS